MVDLVMVNRLASSSIGGLNLIETVKNSSLTVNLILLFLIVLSVVCWALIAFKFIQYRKAVIDTEKFVMLYLENDDMERILKRSKKLQNSPIATLFLAGYQELEKTRKSWEDRGIAVVGSKVDDLTMNVERAMKREGMTRIGILENRLSLLATTAAASPFIGLFGTVYGIMNAFHEIGKTGSATLGTIAPSLSEALVTTAFGLIAAIPAAIFFNYFNARLQKFENESMNIIADFTNYIKRSNV
jgi:biopolymer transport protein TolQ